MDRSKDTTLTKILVTVFFVTLINPAICWLPACAGTCSCDDACPSNAEGECSRCSHDGADELVPSGSHHCHGCDGGPVDSGRHDHEARVFSMPDKVRPGFDTGLASMCMPVTFESQGAMDGPCPAAPAAPVDPVIVSIRSVVILA